MQHTALSLYVHIPWCVQKCPYCDFNSHNLKNALPEQEYISHVLDDLAQEAKQLASNSDTREISSVFIGGGTPSLLSIEGMTRLLQGIRALVRLSPDAEITMEANPGTVESDKFIGFQQAGITRISIGVQSFNDTHLAELGRIHDSSHAVRAINLAAHLGLSSFNVDLMHGLPEQTLEQALDDLRQAVALNPPHISWYQLTIEPNTAFHSKPPTLPNDDILWDIQERGHQILQDAGYQQYEISAYAKPGHQCKHNLNYWRYGDYLGIGCGAHGKYSVKNDEQLTITRRVKVKHPKGYMDLTRSYTDKQSWVAEEDRPFEFFMNRFRLLEACPKAAYLADTGSPLPKNIEQALSEASNQGLITDTDSHWQITALGKRYLNTLLSKLV